MGISEIKLEFLDLNTRLSVISKEVNGLRIGNLNVNMTSQSEAMSCFLNLYESYENVLDTYIRLANVDLKNISSAVSSIKGIDDLEGQGIQLLAPLGTPSKNK